MVDGIKGGIRDGTIYKQWPWLIPESSQDGWGIIIRPRKRIVDIDQVRAGDDTLDSD